MSKYKPLSEALGERGDDRWTLKFEDLEKQLGFSLPKAARERAGWWANDETEPKAHARAWLDRGFRAEALDLKGGEVTFVRHRPIGDAREPALAPGAPVAAAGSASNDPTAAEVMAAADKAYGRDRAAEAAKKAGIVAAAVGVLGGAGLLIARLIGRRR